PRRHTLEYPERLLVASQPVHVEQSRHHFVDGIERRPDALAFFEPIPPRRRERAEIFAAELLLALGELRDHVLALRPGVGVAVGRQLRGGGKKVADEMAAQLARPLPVLRLLPSTQR